MIVLRTRWGTARGVVVSGVQEFGALIIDRDAHRVTLDGVVVPLTRSEYELLAALAARPGAAMSTRELLRAMWGKEWLADTAPLQVHVSRLRRKLGESGTTPRYIVTINGFGYRFDPQPTGSHEDLAGWEEGHPDPEVVPVDGPVAFLVRPDRTLAWVSDNVTELLGWTADGLVDTDVQGLAHPDDWPVLGRADDITAGRVRVVRGRARTVTGDYRYVRASVRPVVDARAVATGFLVVMQAVERPLPDTPRQPVLLATDPPEDPPGDDPATRRVVLTYDEDLVLRDVVPRVAVLGWQPAEVIGGPYSPTGLDTDTVRALIQGFLAAGTTSVEGPIPVTDRGGATVTVRVHLDIATRPDGSFAGLRSTLYLPDESPTSPRP